MADFSTSVALTFEIDDAELRAVRDDIESELGDVSVGVDAGGTGGAVPDGGLDVGALTDLADERNDILDDILDELETGAAAGGGGGGGGLVGGIIPGGDGEGGGGLASLLGGGIGGGLAGGAGAGLLGGLTSAGIAAGLGLGFLGVGTAIGEASPGPEPGSRGPLFDPETGERTFDIGQDGGGNFATGFESVISQFEGTGQDIAQLLEGVDIPEPAWVADLQTPAQLDALTGQTTAGGASDPTLSPRTRQQEFGISPTRLTRAGGASDPTLSRRTRRQEFGVNRAQEQQQRQQRIDVTNDVTVDADVQIDSLRDLQRLLRNPERFITDALDISRGGPP